MTPEKFNLEKINQMLLGESSLQELKPYFPNQEAILKYHAQQMVEHFPQDKSMDECECCHRHSAELQAVLEWRGIYHTTGTAAINLVGIALAMAITHHLFRFLMPEKQICFSTTHGFCCRCFNQMCRRRMLSFLLKQLSLVWIVISALIFAAVIVFTIIVIIPQPTKAMIIYAAIGIIAGTLCLLLGLLATDRIVRWCLPKPLRFISKSPFNLIEIKRK